jgi:hypothetical protein
MLFEISTGVISGEIITLTCSSSVGKDDEAVSLSFLD